MLYGANGYTGELIAREAVRRGERPVLAGRSREKIEPLARELGLEWRAFDLDAIDLSGVAAVLHCAGPFFRTSAAMVTACLAAGVHYLDITGEIAVFEGVFRKDKEAKERGLTLLPGVGFDVVPTDCLAARLKEKLPSATELWLAFYNERGGVSRGTFKTMVEGAGFGGAIRRDGKIVRVPTLFDVREIPFGVGPRMAMTIPWGDVSTAYRSTGIPNIRVYTARSPRGIKQLRRIVKLLPILKIGLVRKIAVGLASRRAPGPTAEQRGQSRVHLWGRAFNEREEVTDTMIVAEGYDFTVRSALAAVRRLLAEPVRAGAWTPSQRFGSGFVDEV
jgi:short subunit dehydrogenase-like uncharacterized protein